MKSCQIWLVRLGLVFGGMEDGGVWLTGREMLHPVARVHGRNRDHCSRRAEAIRTRLMRDARRVWDDLTRERDAAAAAWRAACLVGAPADNVRPLALALHDLVLTIAREEHLGRPFSTRANVNGPEDLVLEIHTRQPPRRGLLA